MQIGLNARGGLQGGLGPKKRTEKEFGLDGRLGQVEEAISKRDEEEDTEQGVPRALVSRVTATSRVLKLPADTGPFAQAALTVTSAAPAPPHPAARNCDLGGAIAVARAAC